MHLHLADYVLWFSSPVILAGVLLVMHKRRLDRAYACFFFYVALNIVCEPVLFLAYYSSYSVYYYAYYINLSINVVLSLAVFLELLNYAFAAHHQLRQIIQLMVWSSIGFVLAVALLRGHGIRSELGPLTGMLLYTDRLLRVAQCALLLLLFVFRTYLAISRRDFVFGIAFGFGLFAVMNLIVATGASRHGLVRLSILGTVNSVAYVIAALIWLGYALWGQVHPRPSPDTLIGAEG